MKFLFVTTLLLTSFMPFGSPKDVVRESHIAGGVVPHHDLVIDEIDRFWNEVDGRHDPDLIVLIGPDHEDVGVAHITTNDNVEHEGIMVDTEFVNTLYETALVDFDSVVQEDHSIQIHLASIQKHFPDIPVAPFVLRSDTSQQEIFSMAEAFHNLFQGRNVFIAASVDFSHYLSRDEADEHDTYSLQSMQSFSYSDLEYMNAEYMDSDQSIVLLSELVCPSHDCFWEEYYHGNSEDYVPSYDFTTSYFTLFLKPAL